MRRSARGPDPRGDGEHETLSPCIVARLIALLVFASMAAVIVLARFLALPGHVTALRLDAAAATPLGLLALLGPWNRHRWAMISLPLIALAHLSVGMYLAYRPDIFIIFFVLAFAFTGLALPRGASLVLAPPAAVAYVLPIIYRTHVTGDVALAALYIPLMVVTGESLAWLASRLRATEAGLRRLDRLKNEFIGMVAHDVRTPMTVIAGFAETLRDDGDIDEVDRRSFLDTIVRNARRCAGFVDNLLQFARIETGEFAQTATSFDLAAMARQMADELVAVYGVRVMVNAQARLPNAFGDEDRQLQVLSNLLSNAIKFSPPGEPIHVDITADGSELRVAVGDHGPGIPENQAALVFEKFASFPGEMSRAAGTGLGLYISRGIVEAGGGRMWLESEPGHGSTFSYTVPAADAVNRSSARSTNTEQPVSAPLVRAQRST